MTYRNRPVLDRKHRPRWQDELRTQQLVVAGFAVAIALALGIFGATVWNGYWEAHLRPVASVAGAAIDRGDLAVREGAIAAELTAEAVDLQSQMSGGPRDQIIEQQLNALAAQLGELTLAASDSLVRGAVLRERTAAFEVSLSDAAVDAEVAARRQLPERLQLLLITVRALPDDAAADDEPTEEQLEAARAEADALRDRVEAGEDFATVASTESDDFTAQIGGDLGWVAADDFAYGEYAEAAADAAAGDVIGPIEEEGGWALLKLVERREAGVDEELVRLIGQSGAGEEAYREYVRDELLVEEFRDRFAEIVATEPQRRVAQILIEATAEAAVPEQRARHILVQPLPGEQDQTAATEEQWRAALDEAEQVHDALLEPDADWFELAEEHSDDTTSVPNGGDLGWFSTDAPPWVEQFTAALGDLEVLGEVSAPVRTDFGYHVIQLTGERDSPQLYAAELVEELQADPDGFAETATVASEDYDTASDGGELGWVAAYQLPVEQEEAIFALTEDEPVSDVVDLGADGLYIFHLLEISDEREIEEERLDEIRQSGFDRWFDDEVQAGVAVWIDPEFDTTESSTSATSP
jgi:parvulin-like peptidyl-prolyl isomerase